jgi:hypothetical protein
MCIGPFAPKMPQMPAAPRRQQAAPQIKSAAAPAEYVKPEDLKEGSEEEKLETRKKKALEIKKTKEGVKQMAAIDEKSMPQGPEGGISTGV